MFFLSVAKFMRLIMNKRELNISNNKLYENTPEDIILKSPFKIPPKGLQD